MTFIKYFIFTYVLPTIGFILMVFLLKPIEWGLAWPLIIISILFLHQLLSTYLLWKRSQGAFWKKLPVVVSLSGTLLSSFMLVMTWSFNHGSGGITVNIDGSQAFPLQNLSSAKIDEFNAGTLLGGPSLNKDSVKGKVVLIEYWGTRCSPCLKALPKLDEVRTVFGPDVLIISNHVWPESSSNIKQVFRKHVKNAAEIVQVRDGSIEGLKVNSVPQAFIFGRDGKLKWNGIPSGSDLLNALKVEVESK